MGKTRDRQKGPLSTYNMHGGVQVLVQSFSAALPLGGLLQFLMPYMMPFCTVYKQCLTLFNWGAFLHMCLNPTEGPSRMRHILNTSQSRASQDEPHGWK